jgi:hypothetical protein
LSHIVPSANLDRDLFVVQQSKNTTTRWNNWNPIWDQLFQFALHGVHSQLKCSWRKHLVIPQHGLIHHSVSSIFT